MFRLIVAFLLGCCIVHLRADTTIDIWGTVDDKDGNPMSGALASLKKAALSCTTGTNGVFHITNNSAVLPSKGASLTVPPSIRGGELYFSLPKSTFVELRLYGLNGRKFCDVLQQEVASGSYKISPFSNAIHTSSCQIAIARLTINNKTTCYKIQNLDTKRNLSGLVRIDVGRAHLSKKSDASVDTLNISKDGEVITSSSLSSLIDSLPPFYIVQRDVSGNFTSHSATIGNIVAILSGDDIPTPKPVVLWYNQPNNSYSGYTYFLKPTATKNYSVNVKVISADSLFVGQSQAVPFTSVAGDITIPAFDPGNARPVVHAGSDTLVDVGSIVNLRGTAVDSFGGTIAKYEWDLGATGKFVQTSGPDTSFHVGMIPNLAWWCRFRATDNDGNKVVDSCKISISADSPTVTIQKFTVGGADTTVAVNDTIAFRVAVSQQFGTSSLAWRFANGSPATGTFAPIPSGSISPVTISSGLDSGTQKPPSTSGYQIKTVAPSVATSAYWIYVQATNTNGYSKVDSVQVVVTGDTLILAFGNALNSTIIPGGWPVNFVTSLSCSVGTASNELVLCARQKAGTISKWEWSLDGGAFSTLTKVPVTYHGTDMTAPQLSYIDTSITPATMAGVTRTVVLRVTNNSNVALDTITIQTGTWTTFGNTPGSIYSAAACTTGLFNLVVNNSMSNLPIQFQKVVNYSLSSVSGTIGNIWNGTSPIALAFDDSIPVCAYPEPTAGGILVKNLTNNMGLWTSIGNPVDTMKTGKEMVLAVDNHNIYVAFTADNGRISVREYNGSNWDTLGNRYVSDGAASSINLAVTGGVPIIAYKDGANGNKLTVQNYQNGAWTALGGKGASAGIVNFVSLKLDGATPCVAYQDSSSTGAGKLTVQKFAGSAWTTVGAAGISNNPATSVSLLVSGGKYSVAYVENTPVGGGSTSTTSTMLIKQYNGTAWTNLGTGTVVSTVGKAYQNLTLVNSNGLYLYYALPVPVPPNGVVGPIKSTVSAFTLK